MIKINRHTKLQLLLLLVFGLTITSCKKKEVKTGLNAIDQNDLLNSVMVDTFQLKTFTIFDDSVITTNPASAVLGIYNDPKFGTMEASFYTQLRISGVAPDFGNDIGQISMDSVVFSMVYKGYYGDFSPLTLEVNEITEAMHEDSTYYAFSTLTTSATNLIEPGFETFTPDPISDVVVGTDTLSAQLRLRLKNSLGMDFINEAINGTGFQSSDNFLNYFKGLRVKTTNGSMASGNGGVFYFNLNDPLTKVTLFYKQNSVAKKYEITINSSCIDFNHVTVDYAGKYIQNVINDTISGQKEFFAQAFASRAVVKIPGISNLPKEVLIHKAELVLPVQYQTGTKYTPGSETSVASHPAGDLNSLASLGVLGVYSGSKKNYNIDLRAFVQGVASSLTENTDVVISPRFFINSADRIIFNGPNTSNKNKPYLKVTYTKY